MKRFNLRRLYFPALSIVTVVLILLILIGVSTYRNLDRDEKKAMAALHRQGKGLLQSLEIGAHAGFTSTRGAKAIDDLIRETAEIADIDYLYLMDADGRVLHHSDPAQIGKILPPAAGTEASGAVGIQFREISHHHRVFELTGRFLTVSPLTPDTLSIPDHYLQATVVLGLKMTDFEAARHSDIHHAYIMAAILVVLGSGVLYFIFVIQNYYLVDKTLKETRDYTRQVVACMANGLISINTEGRVVTWNQLALDLLDLKGDITGMDLGSLIDFGSTGISETLSGCKSVMDHEIAFRRGSGGIIPLSLSVSSITTDQNTCGGAVIILRDLREIKRLEAQLRRSEKLAAIGELAASVAHEIRNPLSSIKGFAQFLRHFLKDSPEEREYADVMVREVDRINRVVTDLLTYARPMTIDRTVVDLAEIISHSIRLVNGDAQSRRVILSSRIGEELTSAFLDGNQITQALLNLLLNALQAVPDGGRVEVGAEMADSGSRIHLWVEDNGVGIPPETENKIFDPFFTTREKGTGLGLAIVQKIVENHQGEIRILSPVTATGGGTRFSLLLPNVEGEVERGDR